MPARGRPSRPRLHRRRRDPPRLILLGSRKTWYFPDMSMEESGRVEGVAAARANAAPRDSGRGVADVATALGRLRLAATLAVVACHAALAYVVRPPRTTNWVIFDPE